MQKFEEDIQLKIQEIWQQIEVKQEQLQVQYQEKLETIIEEVTQIKFEKLAEIKIMYKSADPNDQEKMQEKNDEIENVKRETELLKQQKIKEAHDLLN